MKSLQFVIFSSLFLFSLAAKAEIYGGGIGGVGVGGGIGGYPSQSIMYPGSYPRYGGCFNGCQPRTNIYIGIGIRFPYYGYGYGSHGFYGGYGYGGYGYGYGQWYGGGYHRGFWHGGCGRCHRKFYWHHGKRRCGCNGRRGFALNLRIGYGFGLGLRIF